MSSSRVSIGLPVYNGEKTIEKAIESILGQTIDDWELVISDNCSTDRTSEICKKFTSRDSRIKYCRQDANIGAPGNFSFLLQRANLEYFCWLGADDVWRTTFLEQCLDRLENEGCDFAFSNVVNIDQNDREVRNYPGFMRFSGPNRSVNMFRYLVDPEIMGKANLIYSVYRTEVCKRAWKRSPLTNRWGSDLCFVASVLSSSRFSAIDEVLLEKRFVLHPGRQTEKIVIKHPSIHTYPLDKAPSFIWDMTTACKGSGFYVPAAVITTVRLPLSFVGQMAHIFAP